MGDVIQLKDFVSKKEVVSSNEKLDDLIKFNQLLEMWKSGDYTIQEMASYVDSPPCAVLNICRSMHKEDPEEFRNPANIDPYDENSHHCIHCKHKGKDEK